MSSIFDSRPLPLVMGVLNVTPDSFSDGGRHFSPAAALRRARRMAREGAAIVDVGGESTRPGATAVPAAEELRRVAPVLEALSEARARGPFPLVSIDTRRVSVARAALKSGAAIVNCVEPLSPAMARVARDAGATVIARCRSKSEWNAAVKLMGDASKVLFDPMIGFGTTREEDLALIARIPEFAAFAPVVAAVSRKRLIGAASGVGRPSERLGGSIGAAVWCAMNGASVIRVHDVKETVQALSVVRAFDRSELPVA